MMNDESGHVSRNRPTSAQILYRELALLDKVEIILEKRLRKEAGINRFTLIWFVGLLSIQVALAFVYVYFRTDEFTSQRAISGLQQLVIIVAIYLGFLLFDVFNLCIRPDRVDGDANSVAKTHVIVPTHRSAESLEIMLPQVLGVFHKDQVWVADNGYPDEATQNLCRRLGIHYRFNSIGNKANALLQCAIEIHESAAHDVEQVVLLDDDTIMSPDFFVRHDLLAKPNVAGYCVAIGVDRSATFNLWEAAIDYEYRAISHSFGAQASASTSKFLHGICAVYKIDIMIEIFKVNATLPGGLPFGEDAFAGLDARLRGYRLLQDNHNLVLTYCPKKFLPACVCCTKGQRAQGYGAATLWKQRADRWFLSWPRRIFPELWLMISYEAGSVWGNIQYRIYTLWWFIINFAGFLWVPYLLWFVFANIGGWRYILYLKLSLLGTSIIGSTLRILCMPAKLRAGLHPLASFCFPFLSLANLVMRAWAFVCCIYWFIPFIRSGNIKTVPNYDLGSESVKMLDHTNNIGVLDLSGMSPDSWNSKYDMGALLEETDSWNDKNDKVEETDSWKEDTYDKEEQSELEETETIKWNKHKAPVRWDDDDDEMEVTC